MAIQKLIELLTPHCAEIIEQGSMAPNAAYPARFFTYWNPETRDLKHYDNAAHGYVWAFDVNFYSKDRMDVFNTLDAARKTLLQAGWIIGGKGHSVASDTNTHTGRGFTAVYIEH